MFALCYVLYLAPLHVPCLVHLPCSCLFLVLFFCVVPLLVHIVGLLLALLVLCAISLSFVLLICWCCCSFLVLMVCKCC